MIGQLCAQASQSAAQLSGAVGGICSDYDADAAGQCLDSIARFPCPSGAMDPAAIATGYERAGAAATGKLTRDQAAAWGSVPPGGAIPEVA